jgi:hypothetical protein
VLPVLQDDWLLPSEKEAPPDTLEAKVEIFLRTCGLPQLGQATWSTRLALRSNSSNGRWQSLQTNSYIGIRFISVKKIIITAILDAAGG